jgi:hypothetical protein
VFIPTIDYLMSAPLAALLAAPGVHVVATQITDPGFTGYVFRKGERLEVALPPGRTALERDCMVRYLIGHALRVKGLAPLPAPLRVEEITQEGAA